MEREGDVLLPPGFRFYPTEEELLSFYLKRKINSGKITQQDFDHVNIPQLDIYDFSPWDLPKYAGEICREDPEQWFFFVGRQDQEERGGRACRLTNLGYWKATGSPATVYTTNSENRRSGVIGIRRTRVFYTGRFPTGIKTQWKMNEYKLFQQAHHHVSTKANPNKKMQLMQELSLCRVYLKSKTLRAFERRPWGDHATDQVTHQNEDHRAGTSNHSRDHNGLYDIED